MDSDRRSLYPAALNLRGRDCLVVGAGRVALRKLEGLLLAGARVTVVAPSAIDAVMALADAGGIRYLRRAFHDEDPSGMTLVFACTDDGAVNARATSAARARHALVDRADAPADCDFMGMSRVERGDLLIAVSTGAGSPAYSAWIKRQVESRFGSEYGDLLRLLSELRPEVNRTIESALRSAAWERALDSDALELIRKGDESAARRTLRQALGLEGP